MSEQTLATSSAAGDELEEGQAIPSHLRLGVYRNAVINVDTGIDVSNVQVYKQISAGSSWVEV